jgi:hypothetical protein
MIRQRQTFSAAEFFYAINFHEQSLRVAHGTRTDGSAYRSASVDFPAIWFKKKAGKVTAVKGHLTHFISENVDLTEADIIADAETQFDGRYGGHAKFRWDGNTMWAPQQEFSVVAETQIELNNYLHNFPAIPTGYTGWYSIKD